MSGDENCILMVGGYGSAGREAAKTIRRLYPDVKLVITGRNFTSGAALAAELGGAEDVECDLTMPGLGLAPGLVYQGVVVLREGRPSARA